MIDSRTITAEAVISNMPIDRPEVKVLTDADVTLFFWNPALGDFNAVGIEVPAPGGFVGVCDSRCKITTATTANIKIL